MMMQMRPSMAMTSTPMAKTKLAPAATAWHSPIPRGCWKLCSQAAMKPIAKGRTTNRAHP